MSIHEGHRERLRQRFLDEGLDGFNEINALEMLLFYINPRKDTNPTAHKLLDRFDSLYGVFSASVEELREVDGVGDNTAVFIKFLSELFKKIQKNKNDDSIQIVSPEIAAEVLIPEFKFETAEKLMLLCLDSNRRIIKCCEISRGVVNTVDLNQRLIAETALKFKSSSVILAHNHPGGNTNPSKEDISSTGIVAKALNIVGIQLADHIIVSDDEYSSFCELGYLQ